MRWLVKWTVRWFVQIPKQLHDAMVKLDVLECFKRMAQAPSFEAVEATLEQLKTEADKSFKRLAFTAHPDRGGSTEAMQELSAAREIIGKLGVQRPQPQPMTVIRVHVSSFGGFGGFATSSTGTSTSGTGWF